MSISKFLEENTDFFKPDSSGKVRIRDVIREIPDETVKVAQDVARSPFRSVASIANTATKREVYDPTKTSHPGITKFVFGNEPIKSVGLQQKETKQTLEDIGVSSKVSGPLAGIGVVGAMGLDLYPPTSGKGKLIRDLAKTTEEGAVKTILKKGTSLSDKAIQEITPIIAKSSNLKEIDDTISKFVRIDTNGVASKLAPDIDEFIKNEPDSNTLGAMREYVETFDNDFQSLPEGFTNKNAFIGTIRQQIEKFGVDTSKMSNVKLAQFADEVLAQTGDVPIATLAKERGFVTSVKETFPSLTKVAGQYVPRSTDKLATKARNLINDDLELARNIALKGSDEVAVATATELIKRYADDAAKATNQVSKDYFHDEAANIANIIATKLTAAGRTVQAASILGRLTPEGQVRFAAREIAKYNVKNPTKKIPELTGKQTSHILKEMRAINKMPNGRDKAARFQKLQEYVGALVPTPLMKKVTTVWKAGLLTGIKTSGLNIFSNLSHAILETAKNVPAAMVDSVASLFTGERTKAWVAPQMKGFKEGFKKGLDYLSTGFDERNVAQKLDYNKVSFGKGPIAKIFQKYTDIVFRVIGAEDQPMYYGALTTSLLDQATATAINKGYKGKELKQYAEHLIQDPTSEMMEMAIMDAATAVFQQKTFLGEWASAFQQKGGSVGQLILPFARTPSAVATQVLKYSPAGPVAEILKQGFKDKAFNQRAFSEAMGRGVVGTGVLALGYHLAKKGQMALDRPSTEREQKLWELEGKKPNTVKVGDSWRSPMVLGPAGPLMLLGGHFQNKLQELGSPTAAIIAAAAGGAKSFTEQTFLTGIKQITDAASDPNKFQSYIERLAGSFVPTLVADVARATDPIERRTNEQGGIIEGVKERVQSRLPGARGELEPQVDVLGKEIERIGNPLEVLADPTRPSKSQTSPVIDELRRLTDEGFKVSPTLLGDRNGYPVLNKKQNTQLWKRSGEIIDSKLNSLFNSDEYQELSDEKKGKVVEKFIEKSKTVARAEMVIELTNNLVGQELKEKLSELKAGKLMTRDVYNLYAEMR